MQIRSVGNILSSYLHYEDVFRCRNVSDDNAQDLMIGIQIHIDDSELPAKSLRTEACLKSRLRATHSTNYQIPSMPRNVLV